VTGLRHLAGPAAWLSLATLAGQVITFAVQLVIAALFGAGPQMDAYLAATTLPNYVNAVAVGGLGFVLIPMFASYRQRADEQSAWDLASKVTGFFCVALGLLTVAGVVAARPLLRLAVPGLAPATFELATQLSRALWPTVLFGGMVALWIAVYQARERFAWAAIVPLLGGLLALAALGVWGRGRDIRFLALVMVATSAMQALLLLGGLAARLRFSFAPRDAGLREMLALQAPLLVAGALGQASRLVDRFVASKLPTGSISYLGYCDKLSFQAAVALSGGLSVVLFPIMARHAAQDDVQELRRSIGTGFRLVWVVVAVAVALGIALASPLIAALLQRGAFTAADTSAVAGLLPGYLLAMIGMALGNVSGRGFYALKDTRTVTYLEIGQVAAYVVYNPLLARHFGALGVAYAVALFWDFSLLVQLVILWHRLGRPAPVAAARAPIAVAGAACVAGLGARLAGSLAVRPWPMLVAGGLAGAALYVLVLWLLRIEELHRIVDFARSWSGKLTRNAQ